MYESWKADLTWSAQAFSRLIWPILQKQIGGELIHVEQITNSSFSKEFDQLSGIDAWHIREDIGIRGIASRVQICSPNYSPYCTFTVRKNRDFSKRPTEYEKRKLAIGSQNGWLFPYLTVQSYITSEMDGELRCFAVAKTEDIIHMINLGRSQVKRTKNAEFYIIHWSQLNCLFKWPVEEELPRQEGLFL